MILRLMTALEYRKFFASLGRGFFDTIWLRRRAMKVVFYTNEYPPYTYGGAGVAVEYLTRELAKLMDVEVRCFGDQKSKKPRLEVAGYQAWQELSKNAHKGYGKALEALKALKVNKLLQLQLGQHGIETLACTKSHRIGKRSFGRVVDD